LTKLPAFITAIVLAFSLTPAKADGQADTVVLINTFTVPAEAIDDAIAMWEMGRDFLMTQHGYISTKLHRSLSVDARYLLINVAEWESAEAFEAATTLMRQEAILPRIEGVIPGPQLYTVIRE